MLFRSSDLPPQCTVAASAAAGENDAGKGDHGGVGPGLGGGQFAHRVYHAVLLRPLSQLGDPPALLYHFGLSPALRPGQKSAAVCHSPAAWGGQADPEPLDGLGTGDLFPPPVSPAGGGDGASECGCPAADGARGFAARGVSPVWSGGSGDLRRGVRPLFRGDLPAVPPECGMEGRETEPPRREDFAAGRFHVKRGVICPRPQTPPQSPEREAG